jgi:hypothetical protein
MMPLALFTGRTKELSIKYRNCIEIFKKLESHKELGEDNTTNIAHSR